LHTGNYANDEASEQVVLAPPKSASWELLIPRSFDSDSNPGILSFTENVDCPSCGERFEAEFVDHSQSLSVQDMTEPPRGDHQCPVCDHEFDSSMTGWMFYSEAG
jgi:hypothetical protein